MRIRSTSDVLRAVRERKISISKADKVLKLNALSIVEQVARLDLNRYFRRGVPEIVYARGKTISQLTTIVERLLSGSVKKPVCNPIIASKLSRSQTYALRKLYKKSNIKAIFDLKEYRGANIIAFVSAETQTPDHAKGRVALLSAGTSDIGVLDEAEAILDLMGCKFIRFNDVGIAALQRLVSPLKQIQKFDPDAIVVAAGMEAALPSLIAGLSPVPVIGLPTSVGYGYGGNGEAALMSMLQACPLGICTVNIDGGVSAGIIAWLIASRTSEARRRQ